MPAGVHFEPLNLPLPAGGHGFRAKHRPQDSMPARAPQMRCPICEQVVLKSVTAGPDALWIRCITDGDFTIAEDSLKLLSNLPLSTRHLVLNVAIIERKLEALPIVDGAALAKGRTEAEACAASCDVE